MYFNSKYNPCFFIAEVGSNHEGNFVNAKKLIIEAAKSNADLIKIQIYTPDGMVNKIFDKSRYKHFSRLTLSLNQYIELAKLCKKYKKKFSASIWDPDLIEPLNKFIDIYKVGSGDINNFQIIKKILKTGKPLIISTGLASFREIKNTLDYIKSINKKYIYLKKIALLHCNTAYPTPPEDSNLLNISKLKKKFNLPTGFSDHTVGSEVIKTAYTLGAEIIEKHFSINPKLKSFRDHQISLNKFQTIKFLDDCKFIKNLMREKKKTLSKSEKNQKNLSSFRRSIYAKNQINKGDTFTEENIISLRPFKRNAYKAEKYYSLIGKKAKKNYKEFNII